MTNFNKVGIFMKTFGQEVKSKPSFSTDKINKLRLDLIKEELDELKEAMDNKDLLEVADALTDILYVTYGAGHAFGIDLESFQHTAIESGLDTETMALQTNLIINTGNVATIGAENKIVHTWICYDKHYYFNSDGSITFSD